MKQTRLSSSAQGGGMYHYALCYKTLCVAVRSYALSRPPLNHTSPPHRYKENKERTSHQVPHTPSHPSFSNPTTTPPLAQNQDMSYSQSDSTPSQSLSLSQSTSSPYSINLSSSFGQQMQQHAQAVESHEKDRSFKNAENPFSINVDVDVEEQEEQGGGYGRGEGEHDGVFGDVGNTRVNEGEGEVSHSAYHDSMAQESEMGEMDYNGNSNSEYNYYDNDNDNGNSDYYDTEGGFSEMDSTAHNLNRRVTNKVSSSRTAHDNDGAAFTNVRPSPSEIIEQLSSPHSSARSYVTDPDAYLESAYPLGTADVSPTKFYQQSILSPIRGPKPTNKQTQQHRQEREDEEEEEEEDLGEGFIDIGLQDLAFADSDDENDGGDRGTVGRHEDQVGEFIDRDRSAMVQRSPRGKGKKGPSEELDYSDSDMDGSDYHDLEGGGRSNRASSGHGHGGILGICTGFWFDLKDYLRQIQCS